MDILWIIIIIIIIVVIIVAVIALLPTNNTGDKCIIIGSISDVKAIRHPEGYEITWNYIPTTMKSAEDSTLIKIYDKNYRIIISGEFPLKIGKNIYVVPPQLSNTFGSAGIALYNSKMKCAGKEIKTN